MSRPLPTNIDTQHLTATLEDTDLHYDDSLFNLWTGSTEGRLYLRGDSDDYVGVGRPDELGRIYIGIAHGIELEKEAIDRPDGRWDTYRLSHPSTHGRSTDDDAAVIATWIAKDPDRVQTEPPRDVREPSVDR